MGKPSIGRFPMDRPTGTLVGFSSGSKRITSLEESSLVTQYLETYGTNVTFNLTMVGKHYSIFHGC
jgi:hypothetical protein